MSSQLKLTFFQVFTISAVLPMLPVDGQPSDGQHVSYLIPAQDGGSVLSSHVPPPRHLFPAHGRRKSAHRPRASAMPRHPRARREVDFRDPRSRTWLRWLSAPGLSCSLRPGVLRTSQASALFARCFLSSSPGHRPRHPPRRLLCPRGWRYSAGQATGVVQQPRRCLPRGTQPP